MWMSGIYPPAGGPSVDEIAHAISVLRTADPSALDDLSIARLLSQALAYYSHCKGIVAPDVVLFRARPAKEKPYSNVLNVWGPRAKNVTLRNRFNSVGQPRVYLSNDPVAALFEVRPPPNSYVTLLVAAAVDPVATWKTASLGLEHFKGLGQLPTPGGVQNDAGWQKALRAQGTWDRWLLQDQFLGEIATTNFPPGREQEHYRVSNAVAQFMRMPESHGLLYPSVATSHSHLNFCLDAEFADSFFFPLEAWHVKIGDDAFLRRPTDGRQSQMVANPVRKSNRIDPAGAIDWSDPSWGYSEYIGHASERLREAPELREAAPSFAAIREATGLTLY